MTGTADIDALKRDAGIATSYRDAFGDIREVPPATRAAILQALGVAGGRYTPPARRAAEAGEAHLPHAIEAGGRVWGVAIQLYALRSRRNWGIGDFSDLAALVDGLAALGADAVGLNPLHALFPGNPAHISPYAPSSRLFRNPLYLDVEAMPEFADSAAANRTVGSARFGKRVEALRAAALVDHVAVAALKRPLFERLYAAFRRRHLGRDGRPRTGRGAEFRAFQAARGAALERYGRFEAIAEHLGEPDQSDYGWRDWPEGLRRPDAKDVAAFAAAHRDRVELHHYLQWEIDRQLAAVEARCRAGGMAIGLVHDLAVGFDGGGADAWALCDFLAQGVAIGAPPDQLSPLGQDWGFPPFNPLALAEADYAPFAETLEANMSHGGGLRIDHVLGFSRQFWVPHGGPASDGGYVTFPLEDLLSATAETSRRNGCLVIGEDLGTVPEGFRERLHRARLLSYRLAYFERDEAGELPAPASFPRLALVAAGTHDLPTFSGFWTGADIELRRALGFFPDAETERKLRAERARERLAIWRALERASLVTGEAPQAGDGALATALYRYLARSRSCLLMVDLADLLGVADQINLPGTTDEHPNWRRKMAIAVEAIAVDPRIAGALAAIGRERRRET